MTVRLMYPLHGRLHHDEHGEIVVRSDGTSRWYIEAGRLTPCLDEDGWYRTGDAGSWDEQGRLRVGHRLRPPVMTEWGPVDLDVVEETVRAMPEVHEAIAIACHEADIPTVRLTAVAPNTTSEALHAWCSERLSPHERPVTIQLRNALPRSPAGKVLGKYL
jgi:long-chain acyl-CoA synthetase